MRKATNEDVKNIKKGDLFLVDVNHYGNIHEYKAAGDARFNGRYWSVMVKAYTKDARTGEFIQNAVKEFDKRNIVIDDSVESKTADTEVCKEIIGKWDSIENEVKNTLEEMIKDMSAWWAKNSGTDKLFTTKCVKINGSLLYLEVYDDSIITDNGDVLNDTVRAVFENKPGLCFNPHDKNWEDNLFSDALLLIKNNCL